MKKLRSLQGGYPRQQDYLLTLQNELITMADALFAKLGVDMVLKGCDIVDNGNGTVNISAGIVYCGGEVLRFDGANNVVSDGTKTFVKATPANTDAKLFANGSSQEVYSEVKLVVGNKSSVAEIVIKPAMLYNLASYIQDIVGGYAIKGEIKDVYDFDGTFLENFDGSGLGVTPRYTNWALINGNNSTPDGGGRARITSGKFTNPFSGSETIFSHGDKGGEVSHTLVISELPKHNHSVPFTAIGSNAYGGGSNVGGRGYNSGSQQAYSGSSTSEQGSDSPHNNLQPYLVVHSIIKIA